MNDFRFYSPEILLLVLALPLLKFALAHLEKGARNRLLKFVADENLSRLLISKGRLKDKGKLFAYWIGLALLIVAAARPQANPKVEEVQSTGLDIYVLIDVSRSMDAEDVAPSRLMKAKKTVQHLTSRLSGDRVGIIAYANSAILITPLTSDYSIIDSYLKNLDSSLIPSQGTNLQSALEVAKEAMARGAAKSGENERSNVFIVMSDGETHGESDLQVVDEIRASGGIIFSIAIGTERGAPIPLRDEKGELRGFKTDLSKNTVVSPMNPVVLQELATRGGGHFYFSTLDEAEVEDILARVGDAQRGNFALIRTTVYEELFLFVLSPGVLLLLFSYLTIQNALLPLHTIFRIRKSAKRKSKTAASLALFILSSGSADAGTLSFLKTKEKVVSEESQKLEKEKKFDQAVDLLKGLQAENPDSADLNYNIGTYQVLENKHSQGREQLNRLRSADPKLRLQGLFNIGGSYALEGKKEEARSAYAELISLLRKKEKLSNKEAELLDLAKKNVNRLADPAQQPNPQQDKSENQNKKSGSQESPQENKGDSKQEDKNSGNGDDQKKGPDKQGDPKKEGDGDSKKDANPEEKKGDRDSKQERPESKDDSTSKGDQEQEGGNAPPRRGGQPFRERDSMGEDEARRILGALKEREGNLQKKFLKDKVKGGKVNVDDAAQDW